MTVQAIGASVCDAHRPQDLLLQLKKNAQADVEGPHEGSAAFAPGDLARIVGGAGTGGIIVRAGRDMATQELPARLGHGALVRALEYDGRRLHYEMLAGDGPASGWVSTMTKGKELVVRADAPAELQDLDCGSATLCAQCGLPIGDVAYTRMAEPAGAVNVPYVHGECAAQLLMRDMRNDDDARQKEEAALKKRRRASYDIGWTVERLPSSVGLAGKLGCSLTPTDMCCLVFKEGEIAKSVSVAVTDQPSTAVNLEYLSIALQVRRRDGMEPFFSLDPADFKQAQATQGPQDRVRSYQVKRFQPEWLGGTSVGDVLFQADYHLKELSMGEYEQPVMGMRSCLDMCKESDEGAAWNARQWFIVRKAEVQLSEENALIPCVKMGVEAREQVRGTEGLQDALITRPDHPLVKYAEAFTRNFDLIAERKSVIYHLRELAKASVLAKYLAGGDIDLEATWYNLADTQVKPARCVEIPQLWNEHRSSEIRLQDGHIVEAEKGTSKNVRGMYGGVQFGLERFSLPAALPEYPTRLATRARPKGVDLALDKFELSEVVKRTFQEREGSWGGMASTGAAFWSLLEEAGSPPQLKKRDRTLLNDIFNPHLSDRRGEGERFVAPDTGFHYVSHLRDLVGGERKVRERREAAFFAGEFVVEDAGDKFPASWASSFTVAQGQAQGAKGGLLVARPDYMQQAPALKHLLASATPVFDKSAEDGTRFRIYRLGSLEVRTARVHDGEEAVGAVFSVRTSPGGAGAGQKARCVGDDEKIAKATEYIERAYQGIAEETAYLRYYVVLETDQGSVIVTEKCRGGTVAWEESPRDLEDRTSFARVLRSADCSDKGTAVRRMRRHQALLGKRCPKASQYSREAFEEALGGQPRQAFTVLPYSACPAGERPARRRPPLQ